MTWNIWHGGKEDGETLGPERVIEVIKASGADIIAMQETYGSGEFISESLDFIFIQGEPTFQFTVATRSSKMFRSFMNSNVLVRLSSYQTIFQLRSINLASLRAEFGKRYARRQNSDELLAACDASRVDIEQIRDQIQKRLSETAFQIFQFYSWRFQQHVTFDYTEGQRKNMVMSLIGQRVMR